MTWKAGEPILQRFVRSGRVGFAVPNTVVEDGDDRVVLYLPVGTPIKWMTDSEHWLDHVASGNWDTEDREWQWTNVLQITPSGAWHSVWAMWSAATGEFLNWYVNFQAPLQRTKLGFDTWDYTIDIVVEPNGEWHWKDVEDFEAAIVAGAINHAEAAVVREEADRVIRAIEARGGPFGEAWPEWTSPASWAVPAIPAGWDAVFG